MQGLRFKPRQSGLGSPTLTGRNSRRALKRIIGLDEVARLVLSLLRRDSFTAITNQECRHRRWRDLGSISLRQRQGLRKWRFESIFFENGVVKPGRSEGEPKVWLRTKLRRHL